EPTCPTSPSPDSPTLLRHRRLDAAAAGGTLCLRPDHVPRPRPPPALLPSPGRAPLLARAPTQATSCPPRCATLRPGPASAAPSAARTGAPSAARTEASAVPRSHAYKTTRESRRQFKRMDKNKKMGGALLLFVVFFLSAVGPQVVPG
ncbi:unnamed protein product, partial [Urochloa humidicola]